MAKAEITSGGIFSVPMRKFSKLRCVWAPQYLSQGTRISPMESCSFRRAGPFADFFVSLMMIDLPFCLCPAIVSYPAGFAVKNWSPAFSFTHFCCFFRIPKYFSCPIAAFSPTMEPISMLERSFGMDLAAYLSYCFVMSFTPGPNNLMSLAQSRERTFRGALPFCWDFMLVSFLCVRSSIYLFMPWKISCL